MESEGLVKIKATRNEGLEMINKLDKHKSMDLDGTVPRVRLWVFSQKTGNLSFKVASEAADWKVIKRNTKI